LSANHNASPATPGLAFYFYRLGEAGGGAERMVCQLAGAMAHRGFRVLLVTWDAPNAKAFYPIDPAVQWLRLGFAPGLADKVRRVRALRSALRQAAVRVMVGFVMSGDRTVYAAGLLAGVRLVAAERNAPQMYGFRYGTLQRWLTFRLLRLADCITVQMPGFVQGYPAALRSRIVSIPNPVAPAVQQAAPARPDASGNFTLLAVSRLDAEQKRIGCLVQAFGQVALACPSWQLRIIGDGPARAELQQQINALGLAHRARIEPSTTNILPAFAASHLFAIPSRWEGFPNALAEAMSHGLPAVGFAGAAGVAELIEQGGWLAPGLDDANALATVRQHRGMLAAQQMSQYLPARQYDCWAGLLKQLATREAK
jgi:GalNAc-alpha-(1->4)-GalNAc-alpha-(1->3)-diNAcBac-PP-undecaprenol alpha-1,4-N-acetyl-D-galactosaminyltransferase